MARMKQVRRAVKRPHAEGKKFVRESRYFIAKISDAQKTLTPWQFDLLVSLIQIVAHGRLLRGKPPLRCVVVESDWPEFEPTWKAIEARVRAT